MTIFTSEYSNIYIPYCENQVIELYNEQNEDYKDIDSVTIGYFSILLTMVFLHFWL